MAAFKMGQCYQPVNPFQEQLDLLQVPVESSDFYRQFKKAPLKLELSTFSPKVVEIQNEAKYVIAEKVLPGKLRAGGSNAFGRNSPKCM